MAISRLPWSSRFFFSDVFWRTPVGMVPGTEQCISQKVKHSGQGEIFRHGTVSKAWHRTVHVLRIVAVSSDDGPRSDQAPRVICFSFLGSDFIFIPVQEAAATAAAATQESRLKGL